MKEMLHPTWRDVDTTGWKWPHFTPRELACKCPVRGWGYCQGQYYHDPLLLDRLEILREQAGRPLVVVSARRCPQYNARVGGAPMSQHKLRLAVDISLDGHDPARLAAQAAEAGFRGIGFGRSFLHLDMRWTRTGFHYPNAKQIWIERMGFDPRTVFNETGQLWRAD